jgi:type IV secretion system protein VirB4
MPLFSPEADYSNFIPFSTHVDTHVVKSREGDYMITWLLSGFPFVGREDWELEHRHKAFNNLLQSLRAPDFERPRRGTRIVSVRNCTTSTSSVCPASG